jgi:hypothetical protein
MAHGCHRPPIAVSEVLKNNATDKGTNLILQGASRAAAAGRSGG